MKKNKIYIKSYGCQMNVYDSNRILDLFKNQNYEIADDPKDANLVVLNTCHIREKAAEKVYSDIGRINKLKKDIPKENFKLVVAGCVAQAEGEEIKSRAPTVDFIVGPQSYHKLPDMLKTLILYLVMNLRKMKNLRTYFTIQQEVFLNLFLSKKDVINFALSVSSHTQGGQNFHDLLMK